jgi:cytochrome oxidase assembly protein ShyY1
VRLRGTFDTTRQLLLDGQVSRGQPGLHVWSMLRLENSKKLVLVDRGWIPLGRDRNRLAHIDTPEGALELVGTWQRLPRPGLRLAANDCNRSQWPRVVQYPAIDELRCLLGPELADGVLWLDAAEAHGYRREWLHGGIPPERHYGYALQWFALAVAVAIVFLVLSFRRFPDS